MPVKMLLARKVGMPATEFCDASMQFVREFAKLGLTRSVGGVLALALSRELTPVVTCIILAGAFLVQRKHSIHRIFTAV